MIEDEFEFVEGAFAKDSESRGLSLGAGSDGRVSSSLLAFEELAECVGERFVAAEDKAA